MKVILSLILCIVAIPVMAVCLVVEVFAGIYAMGHKMMDNLEQ